MRGVAVSVLLLASVFGSAYADEDLVDLVDLDGDGDIDHDDRAILEASEVIDVSVRSDAAAARDSARAVTVIETRQARERTADLGEVLSRSQGIQVRRTGGLGSDTQFALNGLDDNQVRFFLDGVPLSFAGWGLGVANIPLELVQRVEVHRGVVPVALGADALGGAVDLITDPSWVNRAAASLQLGSFGTQRATVMARARDERTGLALGLHLFGDHATNDYNVDVEVADAQGRLHPASVPRFHDDYLAGGGSLELGLVARGVLQRGLLRVYATQYEKALQHNLVMSIPYGEAEYEESARGATADVALRGSSWSARLLGGVSSRNIDFRDGAMVVYDWYGQPFRDRPQPGELGGRPSDQTVTETGLFARLTGERALGDQQRLRATLAPTGTFRGGRDLLEPNPGGRNPLSARRDLVQMVTGVEHELHGFDARLENVAFVKHYAMWADAELVRPGFTFVPVEQHTQRLGLGDAVRWRLGDGLHVKASYEWSTRLPSVDELFGDGVLVQPNLDLEPETSHNANLGARIEREGGFGAVTAETNLFARLADRLIVPLGDERQLSYQNVGAARIVGVEGSTEWSAPGKWASVEGSFTFQDLRNASGTGTFGAYDGDRLPNRPWLLGSLGTTMRKRGLLRSSDELSLFTAHRYVHPFYRGWESLGRRDSKQVIPRQLVHSLGVTYALRSATPLVTTVELQNLTDARTFDSFGVQRPGRAVFVKITTEL